MTTTDPTAADPSGSAAARPGPVRVRLTVAYDGSAFHGMAANEGVATVAGTLAEALGRVLRHPVTLSVAGRTDKGVHAHGQVVSLDVADPLVDLGALARAVNGICGPEISVRAATIVADDFDARFSATWRAYRYTVLNRPDPDPFLARTAWWVPEPLDLNALRLGCDPLIGSHDFSSFCRRPKGAGPEVTLVRRVLDARWHDLGDGVLRFDIRANAFCHQMVRSIVGLLVDVGRGRRRAGQVAGIRRAGDRAGVPTVAPPHGLCLWEVGYPALGAPTSDPRGPRP
ncbi:tRNA pseudouridine(38-40) synthase TruA [Rhabdothermincola salaria]|uniref:tRNA pseudouridine(38-40) synthase TruA n=1 Tax=Rhabdothermincola salaria TaxID=2903142 RepID=UPI001E38DB48|nr:tRNA pseudouridine(38-40) synthase TruA [Rhabdothermincola salaria]